MIFREQWRVALFVLTMVLVSPDITAAYMPVYPGRKLINKVKTLSAKSIASFAMVSTVFGFLGVDPSFAESSSTAAQIQINSVPPANVQLNISDLPVLGKLLSGTYARLDTGAYNAAGNALSGTGGTSRRQASVSIYSPADKSTAIKELATKGHLEFDISGVVTTHVNIDAATLKPGELIVKIESPLIPSLPFKNSINSFEKTRKGTKPSNWVMVTNLGDGSISYQNTKTGVIQSDMPTDI
mmetsp:Transcript_16747/g.23654  ORF Transcript_16747/g.23654 Transcript_16747/m.23654 type:complete len:241 (-) Transcript_16747:37-759(-)